MEQQTDIFSNEVKIDDTAKSHILGLTSWAMIIVATTVLGYIIALVAAILAPKVDFSAVEMEGFSAASMMQQKSVGSSIFSLIIGIVIYYFLYQFASKAAAGVKNNNMDEVKAGFKGLKIYFAILAILMILAGLVVFVALFAFL
jgi:hypothetical protein